jgi:hypothetical protein
MNRERAPLIGIHGGSNPFLDLKPGIEEVTCYGHVSRLRTPVLFNGIHGFAREVANSMVFMDEGVVIGSKEKRDRRTLKSA